jgi:hypothetical protein
LSRPQERAQSLDFVRDPELVERASLRPYGRESDVSRENESALTPAPITFGSGFSRATKYAG